MAMVAVDGSSGLTGQDGGLGLRVGGHLTRSLNEPDELSQCLSHDDRTINIVIGIIIRPHRTYYVRRCGLCLLLPTEQRGLSVCRSVCHSSEPCTNG